MKKKIVFLLLLALLPVWFALNCSVKGDSIGEDDHIIVFADSLDWLVYKDPLNAVFGKIIKVPVSEREFILEWKPFRDFDRLKRYKNIMILGRLDSQDSVSANVKALLNPEIIAGVKTGKYFYIPKHNVWALNQYLLILVATSRDDMVQKIYDLGDLAYQDFKKFYFLRLKKSMFKRMEQKKLEEYIADHFPFTMRVQHDYFIADENPKERYLWIRRLHPDRSILIYWQPLEPDFKLTSRWIIDQRNRLAAKIYEGDRVVEAETRAYSVRFKQWPAIRLEGTWKNEKYFIGGPFRNISFIDHENNLVYMIDFYVQAIGRRKKPFLDQLDIIVHTFNPKQP